MGALLELIWAKVHCEQNAVIEPELHCVPFCRNNDPGHWKGSGCHQWRIGCEEGAETLRSGFKGGEGERRARQPAGGVMWAPWWLTRSTSHCVAGASRLSWAWPAASLALAVLQEAGSVTHVESPSASPGPQTMAESAPSIPQD